MSRSLSQEAAREGQVEGLPHPLPPYSIPFMEYVGGYSLWWCIGVVLLWAVGVKKVRQHKQSAFESKQVSAPVDRGPPRLETEGDRFIDETFRPMLAPGERIQHQAYASSWDFNGEKEGDEVYFLALTTTRLLIMMTRKGAFGILFEKGAVDVTKRADVTSAHVDHGKVLFVTASHVQRGYLVKGTRALSNQQAFLMNAGRLLEGLS